MSFDIKGLDKKALLKELWQRQKPAQFFANMPHLAPKWDEEGMDKALSGKIDYYNGRCIKCDLSGDTVTPHKHYDADAGAGSFAAAVEAVRNAKK